MRPDKYPKVGEIVMVCPTEITDVGVYVTILDYELKGLIVWRELVKNRIRSMNKVIQIGKKLPVSVISVDEQTENIMLSKLSITKEEIATCEKNFKESKYVHDIVEFFKRKMEKEHEITVDLREFYNEYIWSISNDAGIIVSTLRTAAKDFDRIYGSVQHVNEKYKSCFMEVLATKFKETTVIVEAVMEITCEKQNGINIIRDALIAGQAVANSECPFKIKVIKPPHYSITIKTNTPQSALEPIKQAMATIKNILDQNSAYINIIKQPEIIIDEEFKPTESDSENESE